MPPLGMLKLQVLFAWVQLLSKLCSLMVLGAEEAEGSLQLPAVSDAGMAFGACFNLGRFVLRNSVSLRACL